MEVTVFSTGDMSVGISGRSTSFDLDCDNDLFSDKEFREGCRADLSKTFSGIWDDKAQVIFEDESTDDGF